jgi:biopolymer transport protein ExbD
MAQVQSGDTPDPNLIPLLDLVLQLVMFFIMVANFAAQQVTSDVMLPLAASARPPDPGELDVIYLNINGDGKLMVSGREALNTLSEVKYYMMSEYATAKRSAESRGDKEVKTVVIIRADKNADFKPVFEVLREAKSAGFKRWQLRATVKNQGGA